MKKLILIASMIALMFTGCDTPYYTEYQSNDDWRTYKGEPIKITDEIYFKRVNIQGISALLQCDKDGNIIHNQNIATQYQSGKTQMAVSVITPDNTQVNEQKFNFKCSDINDCYNQVLVVKNSLGK